MALSDEQKITAELMRQATERQRLSSSLAEYNKGVEQLKQKQKTLNELEKLYLKLQAEGTAESLKKAAILSKQMLKIQRQHEELRDVLKDINATQLAGAKIAADSLKSMGKGLANMDKSIEGWYNKLKNSGLIDMDKAIKQSALQMGVLSKEAVGYRASIKNAAKITSQIGVGIKELTEMQTAYTDELGRNVMLSEQGYRAMAEMSRTTGLGAEGAAKMAAEMENVGLSVERVGEFVNKSLDKSHKLGLNATKTMKNLSSGLKLMNKYSFKDGIAGLDKMSKIVTKLGVSMEFAAGMADKLWDIEGAVDMSAQLQVMGGEWSKLADPFKLMYMARNDMAALTEQLGKAAEASVKFNDRTGEFDISAMEMHKLKIVAEQAGVSVEELATAGKNAAKFTKIKSQISFSVGGGKEGAEMKEFLTNKSFLDKNGKATIMIGSQKKLLSELGGAGRDTIKAMMLEQENMEQRAKDSRTFDEAFTNMINGMKVSLLPLVESMNKNLIPSIDRLVERFTKEKWGEKIEYWAGKVGDFISYFGKLLLDNPLTTALSLVGLKVGGFLFEKANWVANGIALATGFNMGTIGERARSGNMAGGYMNKPGMGTALGAGAGIAGGLIYNYTDEHAEKGSSANYLGKAGGAALTGAGIGATVGSMIPVLGTAIGAAIGGAIGGGVGLYNAYQEDPVNRAHDGLFTSPINDGAISKPRHLGSDFSKGRGIVQNGKITPIDNKDDLLAMKKGGFIDKSIGKPTESTMKVDFAEITINGKLEVVSPGNPGLSVDLLKDPQIRRDITRIVSSELQKNINGGKNRG